MDKAGMGIGKGGAAEVEGKRTMPLFFLVLLVSVTQEPSPQSILNGDFQPVCHGTQLCRKNSKNIQYLTV